MNDEKYTVIFLLNQEIPDKILLLKRAATKTFAPNYYTGIGGKIGDMAAFANESAIEGAYRELNEETEGDLSCKKIKLQEFARCLYENGLAIHYFGGNPSADTLPRISPTDGFVEWVNTKDLFQRDIIPTTELVCKEWQKRSFSLNTPFTVFVKEIGVENTVRLVELRKVEDQLL